MQVRKERTWIYKPKNHLWLLSKIRAINYGKNMYVKKLVIYFFTGYFSWQLLSRMRKWWKLWVMPNALSKGSGPAVHWFFLPDSLTIPSSGFGYILKMFYIVNRYASFPDVHPLDMVMCIQLFQAFFKVFLLSHFGIYWKISTFSQVTS